MKLTYIHPRNGFNSIPVLVLFVSVVRIPGVEIKVLTHDAIKDPSQLYTTFEIENLDAEKEAFLMSSHEVDQEGSRWTVKPQY